MKLLRKWIEEVTVIEPLRSYCYRLHCQGLRPNCITIYDNIPSKICPKGTVIKTKIIEDSDDS